MISRAAQTHLAGHMRPAGRVFETPALKDEREKQAKLRLSKSFIQVSLAIRGGYVPGKFSTANTKTPVLSLK